MKPSFSSAEMRAVLADAVRLAAIDGTDIGTAARSAALLPIVRLAARALRVPVAQINMLTAGAQVPVASAAPNDPDPGRWRLPVGLEASYCQYVVASGEPLVITDARTHELVRGNLATTEAGIVAYAGVPLRAPDSLGAEHGGQVLGSVCVVDFTPRSWSAEDLALLDDLSAAVTAELGIRVDSAARAARDVAAVASVALERAGAALIESEARFRTMANSIPQLAWMADQHGTIDWFNDRFYEFSGKTFEELRGDAMASLHHPEYRERVTARFQEAIRSTQPWEDTFPLRHRDGTYRWFLSRAVPVCDPEEMVTRWFGTNTDVSEQIAAETEREGLLRGEQEARHTAEEASRARTQFLAVMSHELRTPLNAIGGYAELIDMGLRGPVTDAQRTDLARIRRSQQHLLGLINEILNFTKLESGTVSFDADDVAVMEMLHDVVGMILPQAAAKGLRLEVASSDPSVAVRADREKLRQVLINLTTNAVKFTPAPGTVTVGCVAETALVRILVRDTGIGIPPDKLDAVFEPFVQVRAELSRLVDGTGLGLSISRALARGMGGNLTVGSEMGTGSTFTVVLPRATDVVSPHALQVGLETLEMMEGAARDILATDGVAGVLRYLNARTSHRFTGLYAFDGDILRSVALFDREHPENAKGEDAPLHETFCSMVSALGRTVAIADAAVDHRVRAHPARDTIVSYCGALVRGGQGTALGTLCSFDIEARPVPSAEIPLLEAVAPLLAGAVMSHAALRH